MDVKEFLIGNSLRKGNDTELKSNYQIIIEYEGTNYNGWQYQKMVSLFKKKLKKL